MQSDHEQLRYAFFNFEKLSFLEAISAYLEAPYKKMATCGKLLM